MIKPIRMAITTLSMMSMLCLASCNRNYPSDYSCPPVCNPGPQPCAAPCPPPSCANQYPQQAYGNVPQPCATGPNPYYPCDPTFFPCGGPGGCTQPFPESVCYGKMATYSTCDDCVVELTQVAPEFATVGSPYPIEIRVTARKKCASVTVNQTLPCGAQFIKSEPMATPNKEGNISWSFDHMEQGECQRIVLWVKPEKEGCCLATATICACPQLCSTTVCGQPVVCIKKCGPACACLYCPINYRIDVCNSGSATAYDVVIQDTIPNGLSHSSGMQCLSYPIGNLAPGQSRSIDLALCATEPGTVTNVATVSYCGGPKCSAEATTIIVKPCVEVTKCGPDWSYICKNADYTITVTNPGDVVLRNVVVEDISPAGTTVVEAPGAEICCNKAVWCFEQLCPGETKTLNMSLRSQVCGNLTNKVSVTSQSDCGPCTMCAEATTLWKGIAATHMCMVDTVDPLCLGDTTVYRICVTNRGSCEDTNVCLSITFTNELAPQSVNGPTRGVINGQTVTFDLLPTLAPKQSVEYTITVKGVAAGDARAEAHLSSDSITVPDIDTESTHVY